MGRGCKAGPFMSPWLFNLGYPASNTNAVAVGHRAGWPWAWAGLVLGIRRLADLDLNEAQLFSAMTGTLFLTGVFIVLNFQRRAWRRAA